MIRALPMRVGRHADAVNLFSRTHAEISGNTALIPPTPAAVRMTSNLARAAALLLLADERPTLANQCDWQLPQQQLRPRETIQNVTGERLR
jgi:hypothetical protein